MGNNLPSSKDSKFHCVIITGEFQHEVGVWFTYSPGMKKLVRTAEVITDIIAAGGQVQSLGGGDNRFAVYAVMDDSNIAYEKYFKK